MSDIASHQISLLLDRWNHGENAALDELLPLVYDELRQMAQRALRRHPGPSFQTSDLIHETYLKLAGQEKNDWQNRAHFFGVAAKAMRHILVDYARAKVAQKRGGIQIRVSLSDDVVNVEVASMQVLALEDALRRLAELDERKSSIVEMKFYGGMTNEESAAALGISTETVKRDWRFARAWLLSEISRDV